MAGKPKKIKGVYRKRDRWYFAIRVPDPDQPGKTKQEWSRGFATQEEAHTALLEAQVRRAKGERVVPERLPMREYLPAWLAGKRDIKPTTRDSYRRVIASYLIPHLGDVPLGRLRPEAIDAMITHLLEKGAARGVPLSVQTVRYAHTVLNHALNDAIKRRHIEFNPASAVHLPKRQQTTNAPLRYWTREEVRRFYDAKYEVKAGSKAGVRVVEVRAVRDHWIRPLVVLAVNTGMRRGELLGLRWSDLSDDLGMVTVQATRTTIGAKVVEGGTKSGKTRQFSLGAAARDELLTIRTRQKKWRLRAGAAWENGVADLVFTNDLGQPVKPYRVSNEFRRLVAPTVVRGVVRPPLVDGVPAIRFHDLRHTHATLALSAGVRPKIVSERLGHHSTAFTEDVYSHVIPKDDADAADAIDRAVN